MEIETHLRVLTQHVPFIGRDGRPVPHIWESVNSTIRGTERYIDTWVALGNPRVWRPVEYDSGLYVYLDRGYGIIAVIHDDESASTPTFLGAGKDTIVGKDFIVVDRDYHGTMKYVWR